MAAAVGSLMILMTLRPAIVPASLVACLWLSLKQAGTVMTTFLQLSPKNASAVYFILVRTMDEISSGWNFLVSPLYLTTITGLSSGPASTLNGQSLISFCTTGSLNFRPISLLASKTVLTGFLAVWFLAASPMSLSVSVNATQEGVVLLPWSLAMISTLSFCQTPTHEQVVPRSIPIAFPCGFDIEFLFYFDIYYSRGDVNTSAIPDISRKKYPNIARLFQNVSYGVGTAVSAKKNPRSRKKRRPLSGTICLSFFDG